jgi:integrase
LIDGLSANADGDRGAAIGVSFTRFKTDLGMHERQTMHSFRSTFCTIAERAGHPEHLIQQVVGHERRSLLGQRYSGGATLDQLRPVVESVTYQGLIF